MGRMDAYVEMVKSSRLLCPNLKEMTLRFYTGNRHRGNATARLVMRNHLLALRWMNPNAVIYMREYKGQGVPEIDYELWTGSKKTMELKSELDELEVVAKVLMAARDPSLDSASATSPAADAASTAEVRPAGLMSVGGAAPVGPTIAGDKELR